MQEQQAGTACSTGRTSFQQVALALNTDLKAVNKMNLVVSLSLTINFKEASGTTESKWKKVLYAA